MRILDKYIVKAFIGPFLFAVFAFTSIFVGTGTLFRIAQFITEYGASFWMISKAFVLALPSIIVLTFPMSVLLASLLAIGKLSGTSEIIVMRTGGQSFLRLALPIYILAFFISLGTTLFNEYVVPRTNHAYETIVREEIMKNTAPQSQEHIVLKNVSGDMIQSLLYARKYDSDTKELSNITVQEFNNGQVTRIENAATATWNGANWIMHDGIIYDLSVGGGVERMMRFTNQELPISTSPTEVMQSKKLPEEMTIKELQAQIKAYKASYVDTAKLEMVIYERFTIPLAAFIFAIVGAPLGLQPQRSSSSMGFGISVIIIFLYYGVMTLTQAFGKGGILPPIVAVSIPDFMGLVAGIYLNWRASK